MLSPSLTSLSSLALMLGLDPSFLSSPLFRLPSDLVYEILTYLTAEQLIVLEQVRPSPITVRALLIKVLQTNYVLRRFIKSSRAIWLNAIKNLGGRLPLPLPVCFFGSNFYCPATQICRTKGHQIERLMALK